jgi:hypothetical protein
MKRIVLIILLFSYSTMFSQIEYLNGYVIKGNDTINGYLKNEPLKSLHYKISLKTSLESTTERVYLPGDIDEFYIENFGRFRSKHFNVRYVSDIMKSQDNNPIEKEEFKGEDIFAKVLAMGKANLYLFIDQHAVNHYFIEKDTIYELYVKKKFTVMPDNADSRDMNKMLVIQKNYLGKLDYIFGDCPKLKSKIKSVRLNENALTSIVNEYNRFMGSGYKAENRVEVIHFEKGVGVGISLNNNFIFSQTQSIFVDDSQPYNFTPTGGIYLNFLMPKLSNTFSLSTGLQYLNNKFIRSYDTVMNNYSYTYNVNLNTHFIKLPIYIKYTFNQFKIKPYVTAGLFSNFVINATNQLITNSIGPYDQRTDTSYFFKVFKTDIRPNIPKFHTASRKIEMGYGIGIGFKIKFIKNNSFFMESRYENGNGVSKVIGFGNTSKYISFISGVEF